MPTKLTYSNLHISHQRPKNVCFTHPSNGERDEESILQVVLNSESNIRDGQQQDGKVKESSVVLISTLEFQDKL